MSTITSTLQLNDKMSSTFSSITKAMHSTLNAMKSVNSENNNVSKSFRQAQSDILNAEKNLNQFNSQLKKTNDTMSKGSSSANSFFDSMLKANLVSSAISKLSGLISSQLSNAISRFDTLNNYTKVMSNLGVSEESANASRERLAQGLKGLPTTLDSAALAVQRFTSANNNVEASTEMYLALNNALLAGGASQDLQRSAMEQWAQAYSKGKPDMMEWRALLQAMPGQLKQIAKAMGKTTTELGEDLRSGKTSMNDFMKTAVQLNQEGIEGFENFEKQAKNATDGIGTSVANLKSAITRGWTKMFDGANQALEASGLPKINEIINNLGTALENAMEQIGSNLIPALGQSLQGLTNQFIMFGDIGNILVDNTATNVNTTLGLWDYLAIGAQTLAYGIQQAVGLIQLAYLYAVLGGMGLVTGVMSAFYMLENGIEGVTTAILGIIQNMVNQAIGLINGLINAFNAAFGAFGASASTIPEATFGDKAAAQLSQNVQERNAKISGYKQKLSDTSAQIKEFQSNFGQNAASGANAIVSGVRSRQNKATGGGVSAKSLTSSFDPTSIDKLADTVGDSGSGGNGGGKAIKTTSTDKNLLSDDDIQLLLDIATRDYKLNYQSVTPNITLTFGDVRETANVDDILDQVADRLEEIYDADLEVG